MKFQLKTIALSQVFNGDEFLRLYEQAKCCYLNKAKVNFVLNNYDRSEVDTAVSKYANSIIQRGGSISEVSTLPSNIEVCSNSWYVMEGSDYYNFVIPGKFTQISLLMLDCNNSPISMEQITTFLDMIYNYRVYTLEQVLNQ